jgi:hypothetical protein
VRSTVAALLIVCALAARVQAANIEESRIYGTWNVEDGAPGLVAGPIVISNTEILWKSQRDGHQCDAAYHIASRQRNYTYDGGPIVNDKNRRRYTNFWLVLEPNDCDIDAFMISIPSDASEADHFAAYRKKNAQGYGAIHLLSSQTFP